MVFVDLRSACDLCFVCGSLVLNTLSLVTECSLGFVTAILSQPCGISERKRFLV